MRLEWRLEGRLGGVNSIREVWRMDLLDGTRYVECVGVMFSWTGGYTVHSYPFRLSNEGVTLPLDLTLDEAKRVAKLLIMTGDKHAA